MILEELVVALKVLQVVSTLQLSRKAMGGSSQVADWHWNLKPPAFFGGRLEPRLRSQCQLCKRSGTLRSAMWCENVVAASLYIWMESLTHGIGKEQPPENTLGKTLASNPCNFRQPELNLNGLVQKSHSSKNDWR